MKKVGIITVHRNVNYGANLQAFASARFLSNSGFNAEIVDYLPKNLDKDNYLVGWLKSSWDNDENRSFSHRLKLFLALLLSAPDKNKKLKAFYKFREQKCKKSPKYNSLDEVVKANYTDIVCGSDQIWNPDITEGINPIYFGDILGVKNKISYAASLGREKYNETDEISAANLIGKMDYVSVREAKSVDYIEKISGKKVSCVCDPVFLLENQEYIKIAKPIKIKKPYLLVYSVVGNDAMLNAALEFAKNKNLTVVEICQNKNRKHKHIQLSSAAPEEFLGAILNAEYVVTNSFHGTAFSIIFEKNFYVFDNKGRGSRITDLLTKAGLMDCLVQEKIQSKELADYNKVNKNLKTYIEQSKNFLLTALSASKTPITENCVGCGGCKAVCKCQAISLIKNQQGFIKSYIDGNKCVDCGLCKKACPVENTPIKNDVLEVFAYKAKDSLRKKSTSGGAASALAESVINNGGSVYGASLDENFKLSHIRITNKKDIALMQGTKYIQSDMTGIFEQLSDDLKAQRAVLFTGTPCQTAAVLNFVNSKKLSQEKLYLCDIICHGVPSPKAFEDYILWLKRRESFDKYYFRNKELSWRDDSASVSADDGVKSNRFISSFMSLYYSNLLTDEACFDCKFTTKERVSDITVSDFWGIEDTAAQFEDSLGVSMVLINTQKGRELFESAKGKKVSVNLDNAKQPQLKNPTEKPDGYEEFWKNYNINSALEKYGAIKDSLKTKLYKLLK